MAETTPLESAATGHPAEPTGDGATADQTVAQSIATTVAIPAPLVVPDATAGLPVVTSDVPVADDIGLWPAPAPLSPVMVSGIDDTPSSFASIELQGRFPGSGTSEASIPAAWSTGPGTPAGPLGGPGDLTVPPAEPGTRAVTLAGTGTPTVPSTASPAAMAAGPRPTIQLAAAVANAPPEEPAPKGSMAQAPAADTEHSPSASDPLLALTRMAGTPAQAASGLVTTKASAEATARPVLAAKAGATARAADAPAADEGEPIEPESQVPQIDAAVLGPGRKTPQTFGEHLASIGAETSAQTDQTGSADGATPAPPRTELPPPALSHVAGAAFATNGVAAITAPTHGAAPTHPVVSGVPVAAVPVEIGLKSLAGINRFDIRLDPDDLGQIDVRLDISGEGHVRAHIVVERPEALLSLQRETSQLERALEQAGLRTGDEGVSLSLRQNNHGESGGRGEGRDTGGQAPLRQEAEQASSVQPVRRYTWARTSGVDRHI